MEKKLSELQIIINDIKSSTTQLSANKIDEVNVMKSMLNDKDFRLAIYDKNNGYVGERCPANEATAFIKNIIQSTTGLDSKDSLHLAEAYEFTKKDAIYMLGNMRDFINVYMTTGRKLNIIQNESSEAAIYAKDVSAYTKKVPVKKGSSESKQVSTSPFTKIVSISKCPKYENN